MARLEKFKTKKAPGNDLLLTKVKEANPAGGFDVYIPGTEKVLRAVPCLEKGADFTGGETVNLGFADLDFQKPFIFGYSGSLRNWFVSIPIPTSSYPWQCVSRDGWCSNRSDYSPSVSPGTSAAWSFTVPYKNGYLCVANIAGKDYIYYSGDDRCGCVDEDGNGVWEVMLTTPVVTLGSCYHHGFLNDGKYYHVRYWSPTYSDPTYTYYVCIDERDMETGEYIDQNHWSWQPTTTKTFSYINRFGYTRCSHNGEVQTGGRQIYGANFTLRDENDDLSDIHYRSNIFTQSGFGTQINDRRFDATYDWFYKQSNNVIIKDNIFILGGDMVHDLDLLEKKSFYEDYLYERACTTYKIYKYNHNGVESDSYSFEHSYSYDILSKNTGYPPYYSHTIESYIYEIPDSIAAWRDAATGREYIFVTTYLTYHRKETKSWRRGKEPPYWGKSVTEYYTDGTRKKKLYLFDSNLSLMGSRTFLSVYTANFVQIYIGGQFDSETGINESYDCPGQICGIMLIDNTPRVLMTMVMVGGAVNWAVVTDTGSLYHLLNYAVSSNSHTNSNNQIIVTTGSYVVCWDLENNELWKKYIRTNDVVSGKNGIYVLTSPDIGDGTIRRL